MALAEEWSLRPTAVPVVSGFLSSEEKENLFAGGEGKKKKAERRKPGEEN